MFCNGQDSSVHLLVSVILHFQSSCLKGFMAFDDDDGDTIVYVA